MFTPNQTAANPNSILKDMIGQDTVVRLGSELRSSMQDDKKLEIKMLFGSGGYTLDYITLK